MVLHHHHLFPPIFIRSSAAAITSGSSQLSIGSLAPVQCYKGFCTSTSTEQQQFDRLDCKRSPKFTSSKADIGGIKNEEVKLERLKTTADMVLQISGERETVRTIPGTELNVAVGVYEEIQIASDCKDV
ncbi:hypothetical protein V6N11_071516 [Hibiscus sabdariffa]|uniref:Uncharacterized protein n=1 Tax=Hibiscus sabdariffa TaxID=183260 RepID=A0ABR2U0B2_9ROSI